MKIMHLVLTPRFSGAEVLARDLCIAQQELGLEVMFASINPEELNFQPQLEVMKKARVALSIPHEKPTRLQRISIIRSAIKNFCPDVVFAHSVIPAAYARIADINKRRVVSVLHAASNCDYSGWRSVVLERVLNRLSAGIIAVSEQGAVNYKKQFGHKKNIHVIKNGVNFQQLQKIAETRKEKKKNNIILQVGRIVPVKGQHVIIQALPKIIESNPKARLLLAGLVEDEEYNEGLHGLVSELGIRDYVEFLGPRSDVFGLLAQADVYVMPSSAEAHSVAMLEALATGIPVVASNISTLAQFSNMKGVLCIPREDVSAWSSSILAAFEEPAFLYRDVSAFDIKRTAIEYTRLKDA